MLEVKCLRVLGSTQQSRMNSKDITATCLRQMEKKLQHILDIKSVYDDGTD
jgi:hypothetical protein